MKRLLIPALVALFLFSVHVAYRMGQRPQREFEQLCRTPGITCVVRIEPAYLVRHSYVEIPTYAMGEWADDDGRMP